MQLSILGSASASWSPGGSLNDSTIINPLATPTVNTTYNVVVTDVNGCQQDTFVTILVDAVFPDVFNTNNPTICIGDSVQIYISGINVNTYTWNSDNTLLNPNDSITWVKPTQTTTYYVEGLNGCSSDNDSVEVTVNVPNATVIVIENCDMKDGHGGVVLGSEISVR